MSNHRNIEMGTLILPLSENNITSVTECSTGAVHTFAVTIDHLGEDFESRYLCMSLLVVRDVMYLTDTVWLYDVK